MVWGNVWGNRFGVLGIVAGSAVKGERSESPKAIMTLDGADGAYAGRTNRSGAPRPSADFARSAEVASIRFLIEMHCATTLREDAVYAVHRRQLLCTACVAVTAG